MPPVSIVEHLSLVRGTLDRACERLTSPSAEALDECSVHLESAARQLVEWQPRLAAEKGNPEAVEAAWQVRRSLVRTRKLMDFAAGFHENWMRVRGTMSAGYTATGDPGLVIHAGRICLQA